MFTSYFANIENLPKDVIPVAISQKVPAFYKGLRYMKLAPKESILQEWKETHDDIDYIGQYTTLILDKQIPSNAIFELEKLAGTSSEKICLLCYEKPKDFCHRHLVSDWFKRSGFNCKEYENP